MLVDEIDAEEEVIGEVLTVDGKVLEVIVDVSNNIVVFVAVVVKMIEVEEVEVDDSVVPVVVKIGEVDDVGIVAVVVVVKIVEVDDDDVVRFKQNVTFTFEWCDFLTYFYY